MSKDKMTLVGKDKKEIDVVNLKERPAVFSDDAIIKECDRSGCKKSNLPEKQKEKLSKCNLKGHIDKDDDSIVNVNKCSDNGEVHVQVVTDKQVQKHLFKNHYFYYCC